MKNRWNNIQYQSIFKMKVPCKNHIFLPIFLIFSFMAKLCSAKNEEDKVILDMSQIVKSEIQNGSDSILDWKVFVTKATERKKNEVTTLMMYYETAENPIPTQAVSEKFIGIFNETQKSVPGVKLKFLYSFQDTQWIGPNTNIDHQYIDENYSQILFFIAKHSSMFVGISFEITDIENICQQKLYNSTQITTLVEKIKHLVSIHHLNGFSSNKVKIGYVVDLNHIACNVHTENIKKADYLVVNVPLRPNDKIFVESYGIFKENIEGIVTRVNKYTDKIIYYRFQLHSMLDRGKLETYSIKNGKKMLAPEIQPYLDKALAAIKEKDKIAFKRYEQLLTSFVHEWTSVPTRDNLVILDYRHVNEFLTNDQHLNWIESNDDVIPYLTYLPLLHKGKGKRTGVRLLTSVGILLEDVAMSGFDTVMINGRSWRQLVKNTEYFPSCDPKDIKRMNAIYNNMTDNDFIEPVKQDLQNIHKVCGMSLETIAFSRTYVDRSYPKWFQIIKNFRCVKNDNTNVNVSRSACLHGGAYLHTLAGNGICDNACIASTLQYVSGCSTSDVFIWNVFFYFPNDQIDYLVENIMQRLDSFVIARQMVLIQYSDRKVVLQITLKYHYTESMKTTLYCSSLGERIGQFYEAILTWTRIHDFPVILDMASGIASYSYPFSWQQLSISETSPMKDLVASGPLFLRRSYNQSRIFGGWTKGLHPCITKATDEASIRNLNFGHEFSGISFNSNLRTANVSMKPEEVQTLLLFVLGKFPKIEMTLDGDNLQLLHETISNPNFQRSLKLNGIHGKKIYFLAENVTSNSVNILNAFASTLDSIGSRLYIQVNNYSSKMLSNYDVAIVHPNCTHLADKIVLQNQTLDENLRKVYCLICETEPFRADNSNETRMQDYLDSHLYLKKLLGYFYPNLQEIHFRLQPIFASSQEEKTKSLLLFLSDVNTFSKAYKIHYFLLPAFVNARQDENVASFWTITNYTNLANVSVFREKQGMLLDGKNWVPIIGNTRQTIDNIIDTISNTNRSSNSSHTSSNRSGSEGSNSNNSHKTGKQTAALGKASESKFLGFPAQYVYYAIGAVSLSLIILVVVLITGNVVTRTYLSEKEIKEFQNGRQETLEAAAHERRSNRKYTGNIFDGLVFQKEYELSKKNVELNTKNILRDGKFVTAYHAKLSENQKDAVVRIPKKKSCSKEMFKGMLSEAKLLCYIGNHSNIVCFIGSHTKEIGKGVLWIVTEFYEGGSLLDHLKRRKDSKSATWNELELIRFSHEIACGMEYVASENVTHGNLCAKNVLLDQHNICKIRGFQLARKLQEYQVHVKKNQQGQLPWQWMAPESLKSLEFSIKSDIWSFGVTLWEIFSLGGTPYTGKAWTSTFFADLERGVRMCSPPFATKEIFDIMQECWKLEPENRQEFPELVKYFSDLQKAAAEDKQKQNFPVEQRL